MPDSMTVDEFSRAMEAAGDRVFSDTDDCLDAIYPEVQAGIAENFDAATSPTGTKWPERADHNSKNPKSHPLLDDTGALRDAATGVGPGVILRKEEDGTVLVVGVDKSVNQGGIPGAGVHNFGFPDKNIPQREFLGVTEAAMDRVEQAAADWAAESVAVLIGGVGSA